MSALHGHLADYLALRRALGYRLERQEKLIGQFLDHLDQQAQEQITIERAIAWATLPGGSQRWHAKRLGAVRMFARYLHSIDVPVQVPPSGMIPDTRRRAVPYLYSEQQLAALMSAAGVLSTAHRTATYQTLIGLLAATGMRRGEAVALNREDFDAQTATITIRHGKFGKARELPLHASAAAAISAYLDRPDRPNPRAGRGVDGALLVSTVGRRLPFSCVEGTFRILVRVAGLQPRSPACRPRIHDLRHTFAVCTLLDAYRCGEPVGPRVAALSTYLGHSDPSHSYWYLEAAPELMALAGRRLERHLEAQQ